MVHAVFVSGSINAGKSTVAALLSRMVPDGLFLDGDDFAPSDQPFEKRIVIGLARLVEAALVESGKGRLVVVAYPLSAADWAAVTDAFARHRLDTRCITLAPPLSVALTNRGGRALSDWERSRIAEMYELGFARPSFGLIFDNSGEAPEATARRIHRALDLATPGAPDTASSSIRRMEKK